MTDSTEVAELHLSVIALPRSDAGRPKRGPVDSFSSHQTRQVPEDRESPRMARKTIFVSDLTGRTIDENDAATVTIRYADARKGQVVLDVNSGEVADLAAKGTKQASASGSQTEELASGGRQTPVALERLDRRTRRRLRAATTSPVRRSRQQEAVGLRPPVATRGDLLVDSQERPPGLVPEVPRRLRTRPPFLVSVTRCGRDPCIYRLGTCGFSYSLSRLRSRPLVQD